MLIACEASKPDVQYSISTCAPIPVPRAAAVSFVVGEYAYVFGGRDAEGNYLNDLWRYDIANDAWTSMRETPLRSRVNATACVHNGIVYIGLGFNGQYSNSTGYLSDWWSYNASTDTWQQLSDFPANTTARAISLVGDGELYN